MLKPKNCIMQRELPQRQHCPACNRYVKPSTRYHNYACSKCVNKAVDANGLRIAFFNITIDGHGCQGKLVDSGKLTRTKTCYIKEEPYFAEEAHYGGIVIRPLPKPSPKRKRKPKLVDK
jgi:hypothetical protein